MISSNWTNRAGAEGEEEEVDVVEETEAGAEEVLVDAVAGEDGEPLAAAAR